jgi:hypothetical protein
MGARTLHRNQLHRISINFIEKTPLPWTARRLLPINSSLIIIFKLCIPIVGCVRSNLTPHKAGCYYSGVFIVEITLAKFTRTFFFDFRWNGRKIFFDEMAFDEVAFDDRKLIRWSGIRWSVRLPSHDIKNLKNVYFIYL